ncbi:MAG: hypothetical protein HFJ35_03160 [Clostridia bacterium]|nr:hypothetical protein [Clostridia bacterium]
MLHKKERKNKNERNKKFSITSNSVEFNIGEQISVNGKTRVKDYGYFIAKIQESNMQQYLNKFDELIKGKSTLDIQLLEKDTFTIKRVRYNQGGAACYCMDGEDTGRIKEKNLWKPNPCNSSCSYLQKDANGKTACNRIAWLKFFIPEISMDRIWLMRITGQQSIDNINSYLQLQQLQGNSLNNLFTLFLTKKEQTNFLGKTFNNYVLDIVKKGDFISEPQIPQTEQEQKDLSTKSTQNVNNNVEKEQQNTVSKPITTQKSNVETEKIENAKSKENTTQVQNEIDNVAETKKATKSKKQTKSKTKKAEEKPKEQHEEKQPNAENYDNYYVFESLSSEMIKTKSGEKEYTVGKFYDTQDKQQNIIVKPEYVAELQNCELGTIVNFTEIKEIEGKKFALDLNFIQKMEKNIAA